MSENTRYIHTGFYSTKAEKLLSCLHNNMKSYLNRQAYTRRARNLSQIEVVRDIDGEVCFKCNEVYSHRAWLRYVPAFNGYSDQKALLEIGAMLKTVALNLLVRGNRGKLRPVKARALDGDKAWSRNNTAKFTTADDVESEFTVADVYYVYENFVGRHNLSRKYKADIIEGLRSKPLDPIMVEAKKAALEDIARLKDEFSKKKNELEHEYENKYWQIRASLQNEKTDKIAAAQAEVNAEIDKIEKSIAAMSTLAFGTVA